MPDFGPAFTSLRALLARQAGRLVVKTDQPDTYTVVTKQPSPWPQHKGQPMWFGEVRIGKAYTSFHLLPLYTDPALASQISPALKKRMQGKACFNFKTAPEPELLEELEQLTEAGLHLWSEKGWA